MEDNVEVIKRIRTETSHIVRRAFSKRCRESIHGHEYFWEIGIKGFVQDDGMVIDFGRLGEIKKFIDKFDHATGLWKGDSDKVLNFFQEEFVRVLIMRKNTTAENMARLAHRFVGEWLEAQNVKGLEVSHVRVWETLTGSAIATSSDENDILEFVHKDN